MKILPVRKRLLKPLASVATCASGQGAVPKVMSVALIEPFDEWFLSLSKGSGTTRRNDCYTKCGGFDKLNHRNANLLDSLYLRMFLPAFFFLPVFS